MIVINSGKKRAGQEKERRRKHLVLVAGTLLICPKTIWDWFFFHARPIYGWNVIESCLWAPFRPVYCYEIRGSSQGFRVRSTKCCLRSQNAMILIYVLLVFAEAAVVGRGCSTKDKVFYKECETHNYGDSLEKMCFCSFHLCNTSNQLNCPSFWTLTLLVFLLATLAQSGWDPWPSLSFSSRTLIISDATTTHITTTTTQRLRPADHPTSRLLTLAINSSDTSSVRKVTQKQLEKDFDVSISDKDLRKECHYFYYQHQYCSSTVASQR